MPTFRPPTDNLVRYADPNGVGLGHSLFRHYAADPRGRNVYKLTDGTFSEIDQRNPSDFTILYHGGHDNIVTDAEAADLTAAGYGEYLT